MEPFIYNFDDFKRYSRKLLIPIFVFLALSIASEVAFVIAQGDEGLLRFAPVAFTLGAIFMMISVFMAVIYVFIYPRRKAEEKLVQACATPDNIERFKIIDCVLYITSDGGIELRNSYTPRYTDQGIIKNPHLKGTRYDYSGRTYDIEDMKLVSSDKKVIVTKPNEVCVQAYFKITLRSLDDPSAEPITLQLCHDLPIGYYIRAVTINGKRYWERRSDEIICRYA